MSNIYLCSFASPDLKLSVQRFVKQSEALNFYKEVRIFGWKDLTKDKQKQIKFFFKKGEKRLFGYASWKPDIILSYLNQLPKDSILQYTDIGCNFNPNGLKRLNDYVELTNKNDILVFKYNKPEFHSKYNLKYQIYFEHEYTKADLWKNLKINDESEILNSEQIWSGVIFFKNNLYVKKIIEKWAEICKINNLIDDSPSQVINHTNFVEHRHDQSVFSLICKQNKFFSLSASECEWAEFENKRTWSHLSYYPILAKRDKKYNLIKRFLNRQKKNIKRHLKFFF